MPKLVSHLTSLPASIAELQGGESGPPPGQHTAVLPTRGAVSYDGQWLEFCAPRLRRLHTFDACSGDGLYARHEGTSWTVGSARTQRGSGLWVRLLTSPPQHTDILHLMAFGCDSTTSARLQCSAVLDRLLAHPDMDEETANAVDLFGQTPLHVSFHSQASGDCAPAFLRSPKVLRGDADR